MVDKDPSDVIERKYTVSGVFHRSSSTYGRIGPNFFSHFGRNLVSHANLPLHARVLDVACGRGAVLFPAANAVGPKGFVTGIDFAEGMVKETAREVADRGLSNVGVYQMDAEHLDFRDSSFDAVLCGFAIFFFPQLERALAEFRRVLKPGGSIAVSTWGNQFDEDFDWFDQLVKKYLPPAPHPAPQDAKADHSSDGPEF